ncbi:TPA: hypothetical protein HA273_00850 [Candidatus Bathyarchaeota archaeon]|nr:hypothetical protein [Candidatus Bathyarchaeota archaeon]
MQQMLKSGTPILIHGFALVAVLVTVQLLLDAFQEMFLLYKPPIGFALFLLTMFGIQPIILGAFNIVLIHRLYSSEGWQLGFWLNGFFLLLIFLTINLVILTIGNVSFSIVVGVVEIFLLSYPFGYLGKFSNRGSPKA